MPFALFADSSCNIPQDVLIARDIHIIPLMYTIGEETYTSFEWGVVFDSKAHFDRLRAKDVVHTSLINTEVFVNAFTPFLQAGQDIVYVCISSGISGTYQAALLAAEELEGKYGDARVYVADTLGASAGEGIMTLRAADMRDAGESAQTVAAWATDNRLHICHILLADDLQFLHRGGRLPAVAATIGTVLDLKPLWYFDAEGKCAVATKVRGKNRALKEMVRMYGEKTLQPQGDEVRLVHGDCEGDALELKRLLEEAHPGIKVLVDYIEPIVGAHTGPGSLALVFWGKER